MPDSSRFYGRVRELDEMEALLDGVLDGHTCTAFISGEAGTGKSALVEAFVERVQQRDSALIATLATCNSHTGQSDAYLPFLDTLAQLTGDSRRFKAGSISETNAHRLEGFVEIATRAIINDVPELIGHFIPGGSLIFHTIHFTARKAGLLKGRDSRRLQQQLGTKIEADKIYQLYADLLAKLATHAPLVIVLEDLHWVDQSSAQLLFSLSRRIVDAPILFLGTFRTNDIAVGRGDERHPLVPVIHELKRVHGDILIELAEETDDEREAFVSTLLDSEVPGLGESFRAAFVAHTGGHALFSRELLASFCEKGVIATSDGGTWTQNGPIDWLEIPPRVEGVIEERIDRLDEEMREIMAVASVQGETFLVEVLAELTDMKPRSLLRLLSRQLEGVHALVQELDPLRIGSKRLARYRFSHHLFQQYLYDELGRAERRQLHADVGKLLEAEYGDARDDIANQLAYHFAAAEDFDRAIHYYLVAAQRSLAVSSYDGALGLLQTALDRTSELAPEDAIRAELTIRLEMGTIHQALRGFTNPDAEACFSRAQELAIESGDRPRLALAMFGLWEFHLFKLDLDRAQALADGIGEIAQAEDDDILGVIACRALANVAYQKGEMASTITHANQVIDRYHSEQIRAYILRLTYDPKLFALGMRSWAESVTGELARSEETLTEMFEWAEKLDHPASTCVAHLSALKLHYNLGNVAAIGEHAAAMLRLADTYGFFWYKAFGGMFAAWHAAMTSGGEVDAAAFAEEFETFYRSGVAPDGNLLIHSQYCRMLGEGLLSLGEFDASLGVLDEGISVCEASGENVYLGELTRLRGVVRLERGDGKAAVSDLRRAISLTRQHGQKLFELRARASLCRALAAGQDPTGEGEALSELRSLLPAFADQAGYADVEDARSLV